MREIHLGGKFAAGRVALVDDADYDLVMQHKWHIVEERRRQRSRIHGPYARTMIYVPGQGKVGKKAPYMHNLIIGQLGVDHRDHDGLNNQRSNLRPATPAQNSQNVRKISGCSSQYKGVTRRRDESAWRAVIVVDRKSIPLGRFAHEVDAARAYDAAALRYFGEFASLNFPGLDAIPDGGALLDAQEMRTA